MTTETQRQSHQKLTDIEAKQMKVLAAIKQNGSATTFQLVKILNWPVNRISGRITELCSQGLIFDSGRRLVNPESGRNCIVWRAL